MAKTHEQKLRFPFIDDKVKQKELIEFLISRTYTKLLSKTTVILYDNNALLKSYPYNTDINVSFQVKS